jgi:hypothetical protein
MLRKNLHVGKDRHEVGVARPTGHQMEVDVVGDARAGEAAQVPPEVVPLRAVHLRQRAHALTP